MATITVLISHFPLPPVFRNRHQNLDWYSTWIREYNYGKKGSKKKWSFFFNCVHHCKSSRLSNKQSLEKELQKKTPHVPMSKGRVEWWQCLTLFNILSLSFRYQSNYLLWGNQLGLIITCPSPLPPNIQKGTWSRLTNQNIWFHRKRVCSKSVWPK